MVYNLVCFKHERFCVVELGCTEIASTSHYHRQSSPSRVITSTIKKWNEEWINQSKPKEWKMAQVKVSPQSETNNDILTAIRDTKELEKGGMLRALSENTKSN